MARVDDEDSTRAAGFIGKNPRQELGLSGACYCSDRPKPCTTATSASAIEGDARQIRLRGNATSRPRPRARHSQQSQSYTFYTQIAAEPSLASRRAAICQSPYRLRPFSALQLAPELLRGLVPLSERLDGRQSGCVECWTVLVGGWHTTPSMITRAVSERVWPKHVAW